MSDEDDDEALTWAGARDPSLYETPEPKTPKPERSRRPTRSVATDDYVEADEDEDDAPPAMSAVMLVCLGVLGGIYALYTIGWFVSWQRLLYTDPDILELSAFHIQQVLAILAPPLWFVVTLLFTRERRPAARLIPLVIGAVLLVPWSFTFGQ